MTGCCFGGPAAEKQGASRPNDAGSTNVSIHSCAALSVDLGLSRLTLTELPSLRCAFRNRKRPRRYEQRQTRPFHSPGRREISGVTGTIIRYSADRCSMNCLQAALQRVITLTRTQTRYADHHTSGADSELVFAAVSYPLTLTGHDFPIVLISSQSEISSLAPRRDQDQDFHRRLPFRGSCSAFGSFVMHVPASSSVTSRLPAGPRDRIVGSVPALRVAYGAARWDQ